MRDFFTKHGATLTIIFAVILFISSELLKGIPQYLNYTNLIIFFIICITPVGLSIYFNNTKKDNS